MPARLLLVLILLVHPARGAAMAVLDALDGSPASCSTADGVCCPLCDMLDACPCVADEDAPVAPTSPPARPTENTDSLRALASNAAWVPVSEDRSPASPRAPPIMSLRALDGSVAQFLSRLCVWTT